MIVNMIFFFEWEKGETDDFETHVAFAWLQKREEKVIPLPGIEPGPPAWQASILPLNQRC